MKPKDHEITFGRFEGRSLDRIPLTCLDWLIGNDWLEKKYPEDAKQINEYLSDPAIARELNDILLDNEVEEDIHGY